MIKKIIFILATLVLLPLALAAEGIVNGTVIDNLSGEPMIGVVVFIKDGDKTYAGVTDFNGNYTITKVPAGSHTVKFQIAGYQPYEVNVAVLDNKRVSANVAMAYQSRKTVVVQGRRISNTTAALTSQRKKAAVAQDAISAEQIKKSPDSNAADAAKRVTGVSILGGKYIYIRGLSERYSTISVNGLQVPSPLPSRKVVPLDIFPVSLLDNLIISKSYLSDMASDSTAGAVQLNTRDYPTEYDFKVGFSLNYNSQTTFKDFLALHGSDYSFFGFDAGERDIPDLFSDSKKANNSNYTLAELDAMAKSFRRDYIPSSEVGIPGGGFNLSFGNTYNYDNGKALGLLFSVAMSESSKTIKDAKEIRYQGTDYKLVDLTYDQSTFSTVATTQLSLAYAFSPKNKIKYNTFYTHQSDTSAKIKQGKISEGKQYGTEYISSYEETNLWFNQFTGDHVFDLFTENNAIIWNVGYSLTTRKQPDVSTLFYMSSGNIDPSIPMQKYYNDHREISFQFAPEYVFPFKQWDGLNSKIRIGSDIITKKRVNEGRRFRILFQNITSISNSTGTPEELITNNDLSISELTGDNLTTGLDSYEADLNIYSGYGIIDLLITRSLRIIGGVRVENWKQTVSAYSIFYKDTLYTSSIINTEILPNANIVYTMMDKINLRFGYSKTINRPEFVEMGMYNYYDQLETGFIIKGNPNLEKADIQNYDLRFEFFPTVEEILALSFFLKDIQNPIEATIGIADDPTFTFANQKKAMVYGFELEIKKDFSFIAESLKALSVLANFTWSYSEIELDPSLGSAETDSSRSLQGQSPMLFNFGLTYKIYSIGSEFALLYNYFARRIVNVGVNGLDNVYEEPFNQLDITFSQKIFKEGQLKISIANILNDKIEQNQGTGAEKKLIKEYKKGVNVSFGYTHSL